MPLDRILINTQLAANVSGSAFGAEVNVGWGGAGSYVLPAGEWLVQAATGVKVQYSPDAGSTWRDLTPTATGGVFYSDGFNVRLNNSGGTPTQYILPLK